MPENSPGYLTLKMNRTSVMLYTNRYVTLPGEGAALMQSYLGSFPVTATEVPEHFEALLRDATRGRPERYHELMQRIAEKVLMPARIKRDQEEERRSIQAIENTLNWTTQNLAAIPAMPFYSKHVRKPEVQQLLRALLDKSSRLDDDIEYLKVEQLDVETAIPPEARLRQLLETVETACLEITGLMPQSAGNFSRGYAFQAETVAVGQRVWFRAADAIGALSARKQFMRPSGWGELRSQVLGDEIDGAEEDAKTLL